MSAVYHLKVLQLEVNNDKNHHICSLAASFLPFSPSSPDFTVSKSLRTSITRLHSGRSDFRARPVKPERDERGRRIQPEHRPAEPKPQLGLRFASFVGHGLGGVLPTAPLRAQFAGWACARLLVLMTNPCLALFVCLSVWLEWLTCIINCWNACVVHVWFHPPPLGWSVTRWEYTSHSAWNYYIVSPSLGQELKKVYPQLWIFSHVRE